MHCIVASTCSNQLSVGDCYCAASCFCNSNHQAFVFPLKHALVVDIVSNYYALVTCMHIIRVVMYHESSAWSSTVYIHGFCSCVPTSVLLPRWHSIRHQAYAGVHMVAGLFDVLHPAAHPLGTSH
jgi:hypothetical protein